MGIFYFIFRVFFPLGVGRAARPGLGPLTPVRLTNSPPSHQHPQLIRGGWLSHGWWRADGRRRARGRCFCRARLLHSLRLARYFCQRAPALTCPSGAAKQRGRVDSFFFSARELNGRCDRGMKSSCARAMEEEEERQRESARSISFLSPPSPHARHCPLVALVATTIQSFHPPPLARAADRGRQDGPQRGARPWFGLEPSLAAAWPERAATNDDGRCGRRTRRRGLRPPLLLLLRLVLDAGALCCRCCCV